jgi:hypothetical protein
VKAREAAASPELVAAAQPVLIYIASTSSECPLGFVQAVLGCDPYTANWLDPEHWLVAPTEAMPVLELSDAGRMAQLRHKLHTEGDDVDDGTYRE